MKKSFILLCQASQGYGNLLHIAITWIIKVEQQPFTELGLGNNEYLTNNFQSHLELDLYYKKQ